MSDLVKRLRGQAPKHLSIGEVIGEAADALEQKDEEIERLREELEHEQGRRLTAEKSNVWWIIAEQRKEENERLQAALIWIAHRYASAMDGWPAEDMAAKAREALGQKEAKDG